MEDSTLISLSSELEVLSHSINSTQDLDKLSEILEKLRGELDNEIRSLQDILGNKKWQEDLGKLSIGLSKGTSSPASKLVKTIQDTLKNAGMIYETRRNQLKEIRQLIGAIEVARPLFKLPKRFHDRDTSTGYLADACRQMASNIEKSIGEYGGD